MHASQNQICGQGQSPSQDARRSESQIDNPSEGSPAKAVAKRSRARLEANRKARPGQAREASNVLKQRIDLGAQLAAVLPQYASRAEIAKQLGISVPAVRKIECLALAKLARAARELAAQEYDNTPITPGYVAPTQALIHD